MATQTTTKPKILTQLFTSMKSVKARPTEDRPVLEHFIYAMLRENATRDAADQAFGNLRERFYDWNEVRVSSTLEIVEALDGALSDAEMRAQRIIDFLQEIFETTYSFDLNPLLEVLEKKGLKQASKQLLRYQAANDYAVATVMRNSLDNHAIPLDDACVRVLKRMGVIEPHHDMEAVRTNIEQQIPKAKSTHFIDMISVLADTSCHEEAPACRQCPVRSMCPTGLEAKAAVSVTSKKSR